MTNNESKIMLWLATKSHDLKLGVAVMGIAIGVLGFGASFSGKMTPMAHYCLQKDTTKICKPSWVMPIKSWEKRQAELPYAVLDKITPPTNPYKPLLALIASGGFGLATVIFRQLQNDEERVQEFEAIERGKQLAIARLQAEAEIETYLLDKAITIQQAELVANTELEVAQLQQEADISDFKFAGWSEDEIKEFIRDQTTPFAQLPGMSLDEVNDPSDKVVGEDNKSLTSNWDSYRQVGNAIIKSMIVSDKSILIAAGTGCGKTTTEQYYLQQFVSRYPKAELYALLNKNDDLFGVKRDRKTVFSPESLDNDLETALRPLYQVYDIYLSRKDLSTSDRRKVKENKPIRLILGDWYATYQELQARLDRKELQRVLSMIRQIITVGRDSGIGLVIDTQSANLDSLGLANDASIRQSLDIFSQGYIYFEDGHEKGELQTIRLTFSNNSICGKEDRESIQNDYELLTKAIQSGELKTPIIFSSVGSKPRLGIVPDLSSPLTNNNTDWESVIRHLDVTYQRSEFMIDIPAVDGSEDIPEAQPLTDIQLSILDYLKERGKRTLKQIADSKRLGFPETRKILEELARKGLIKEVEDGYEIAD
jgi:uncharacterized membrane protein